MSDGAAVIGAVLLFGAGLVWRGRVPPRPHDPPTYTQPAPLPVQTIPSWPAIPSTGAGVWIVLMDADEKDVIECEYAAVHRRPFKVRYDGREYLVARGSVTDGYFIYRQVDRAAS